MGWIAEPGEEEKDKFPVDTLVKKLKDETDETGSVCEDYHGQARKCCDGIRTCFVTLQESFSTVKLQAIGNQNMHKACRRLTTDLEATRSCIVSWTGYCHGAVNTEQLSAPFHDTLDTLQTLLNENCSNLPPESTTLKGDTVRVNTTTTTARKTSPTTTSTSTTSSTTTTTTPTKPITVIFTSTIYVGESKASTLPEDATEQNVTQSSQNDVTKATSTAINKSFVSTSSTTDEHGQPNHPTNNRPGPSRESTTSSSTTFQSTSTFKHAALTEHTSNISDPTLTNKSDPTLTTYPTRRTSADSSDLSKRNGDEHQGPSSDNTIIIISSVVGSILFLCVTVLCIFIMYKKKQQKNTDSGGSFEPDGKPRFFTWLFKSPQNAASVQTDTEIYAEIDEAFMEAVYKYDKDKPNTVRDRISSNTQFNMCYESGFNDDDIIPSRDKLNATESSILPIEPLNPLALIRKENDAITSFRTDQSKGQERQNNTNDVTNSRKGFLTRRPGFTDIRPDSSDGEYVYIEAQENDNVFKDEQIYAVPSFEESDYDTADYGRNPERNISQAPEQTHYSYIVYNSETNVQQNVKEYRRSSSDVETHIYENQDTLMEY